MYTRRKGEVTSYISTLLLIGRRRRRRRRKEESERVQVGPFIHYLPVEVSST
jgi:hypothetical protein